MKTLGRLATIKGYWPMLAIIPCCPYEESTKGRRLILRHFNPGTIPCISEVPAAELLCRCYHLDARKQSIGACLI